MRRKGWRPSESGQEAKSDGAFQSEASRDSSGMASQKRADAAYYQTGLARASPTSCEEVVMAYGLRRRVDGALRKPDVIQGEIIHLMGTFYAFFKCAWALTPQAA